MARLFVNNFSTNLNEAVADTDTTFDLVDASGLGSPSGGDFIACTIDDNAGNREIIHVTGVSSNTITCTRGQEGTAAQNWSGTELIEARLTADGLNEKADVADLPAAPALKFIASATASNSATLSFTDLGDYAYVEFVFVNLLPEVNDQEFWMRTSSNNGTSYDSGTSDYGVAHLGRTGATSQLISLNPTNKITLCQAAAGLDVSNEVNEGISGNCRIFDPSALAYTRVNYQIGFINGNGNAAAYSGSGVRLATTGVNGARFLFSSGNITSGSIYVYGLSKS